MPLTRSQEANEDSSPSPPNVSHTKHPRSATHAANPLSTHQLARGASDDTLPTSTLVVGPPSNNRLSPQPQLSQTNSANISPNAQPHRSSQSSTSTANLSQQALAEVRFSRAFTPLLILEEQPTPSGDLNKSSPSPALYPKPFYSFIPHLLSSTRPRLDEEEAADQLDTACESSYPAWLPSDFKGRFLVEMHDRQRRHNHKSKSQTFPLSSLELLVRSTLAQLASSTAAVVGHIISTNVLRHIDKQVATLSKMERVAEHSIQTLSESIIKAQAAASPPNITIAGHEQDGYQSTAHSTVDLDVQLPNPTLADNIASQQQMLTLLTKVQRLCREQRTAQLAVREEYELRSSSTECVTEAEALQYWRTLNFVFSVVLFGPTDTSSWTPNLLNHLKVSVGDDSLGSSGESNTPFDSFFGLLESFGHLWLRTLYPQGRFCQNNLSSIDDMLLGSNFTTTAKTSLSHFYVVDTTREAEKQSSPQSKASAQTQGSSPTPQPGNKSQRSNEIPNASWDAFLHSEAPSGNGPREINRNIANKNKECPAYAKGSHLHLLPALLPLHARSAGDQFRLMFNPLPTSLEQLLDSELQHCAVGELESYCAHRSAQKQSKIHAAKSALIAATQRSSLSSKVETLNSQGKPAEPPSVLSFRAAASPVAALPIGASVSSDAHVANPNFIASVNSNNLFKSQKDTTNSSSQAQRVMSISVGGSDGGHHRNSTVIDISQEADSVFVDPSTEEARRQRGDMAEIEMAPVQAAEHDPRVLEANASQIDDNLKQSAINNEPAPTTKAYTRDWGATQYPQLDSATPIVQLAHFLSNQAPHSEADPSLSSLAHMTDLWVSVVALETHILRAVARASHPTDPLSAAPQELTNESQSVFRSLSAVMEELRVALLKRVVDKREGAKISDNTDGNFHHESITVVDLRDLQLLLKHSIGLSAAFNDTDLPLAAGLQVSRRPVRHNHLSPNYPSTLSLKLYRSLLFIPSAMPMPQKISPDAETKTHYPLPPKKRSIPCTMFGMLALLTLMAIVASTVLSILSIFSKNRFEAFSASEVESVGGWAAVVVSIVSSLLFGIVAFVVMVGVRIGREELALRAQNRQRELVEQLMGDSSAVSKVRSPVCLPVGPLALFAMRVSLMGGGRHVPQCPPTLSILRSLKLDKSLMPKNQKTYNALLLSMMVSLQSYSQRADHLGSYPQNTMTFLASMAAGNTTSAGGFSSDSGPDRVISMKGAPKKEPINNSHPIMSRLGANTTNTTFPDSNNNNNSTTATSQYRQSALLLIILHKVAAGDDAKYLARRRRLRAISSEADEEAVAAAMSNSVSVRRKRVPPRRPKAGGAAEPKSLGDISNAAIYSSVEAENSSDAPIRGESYNKMPPALAHTQKQRPQGSAGRTMDDVSVADMQELLREAGNFTVAGSDDCEPPNKQLSAQLSADMHGTSKESRSTSKLAKRGNDGEQTRTVRLSANTAANDYSDSSDAEELDDNGGFGGDKANIHDLGRRKSSILHSLGIFPQREGLLWSAYSSLLLPGAIRTTSLSVRSDAAHRKRSMSNRSDGSHMSHLLPPRRTASQVQGKRGGTDAKNEPSKPPQKKSTSARRSKNIAKSGGFNGEETVSFAAGGTFRPTPSRLAQHSRPVPQEGDYDSGDKYRVSQDSSVRTASTGGAGHNPYNSNSPHSQLVHHHPIQLRVPPPSTMLSLGQVLEGFRSPSALGSASTAGDHRPTSREVPPVGISPESAHSASRPPSQPFAEEQYSTQQVDVKVSTLHQHLVLIGIRKFKVFTWSKAAQDLTGLTEAEVRGSHMATLVADGVASLNTIKSLFANADRNDGPSFGRIALLSKHHGTVALRCSVGVAKIKDLAKNKVSTCAIIVGTVLDETDVNAIHYIYQVQRAVEQQLRAKAMAEVIAVSGRVAATTAVATYLASSTAAMGASPNPSQPSAAVTSLSSQMLLTNAHKARSAGVHAANAAGLWWMRKAPTYSRMPPLLRQMLAPAQGLPYTQPSKRGGSPRDKLAAQHVKSNVLSDLNAKLVNVGGSVSVLRSFLRHSHWADLSARCASVKHWARVLPDDLLKPVLDFCNEHEIEMKILIDRSVGTSEDGSIYCDVSGVVGALTVLLKAIATTDDGTITTQSVVMHLVQRELVGAPATSKQSMSQGSVRSGATGSGGYDSSDMPPPDPQSPASRDNAGGYLFERVAGEAGGLGKVEAGLLGQVDVGDGQLIPRLQDTADERDVSSLGAKSDRSVVLAINFEIPDDSSFSWADTVLKHNAEGPGDGELQPHSALYLKVTGVCFVTRDGAEPQASRQWPTSANLAMVPPTEAGASEFFLNKLCGIVEADIDHAADLPEGGEDVQSVDGMHSHSSRNPSISSRGGAFRPPSTTSIGSHRANHIVTSASGRPGEDPSNGQHRHHSTFGAAPRTRTNFEVIVPISLTPLDSTSVGLRGPEIEEDALVLTILIVQPNAAFATYYSHSLSQRRHMIILCDYNSNADLIPALSNMIERRSPDLILVADSCVSSNIDSNKKGSSSSVNQKPPASAVVALAKSAEAVLVWAADFGNPNRAIMASPDAADQSNTPTTKAGQLQALLSNNLWGQENTKAGDKSSETKIEIKEGPNTNNDGSWIIDNRLTCLLREEDLPKDKNHQTGIGSSMHYGSLSEGPKKRTGVWKRIIANIEQQKITQKALQQRREYYQKVEVVGKGMSSEVWKVKDMATKGILAVKVMRGKTDSLAASILKEIETLSRLEHPHIVRYLFARMGFPDNATNTLAAVTAIAHGNGSPVPNAADGAQLQPPNAKGNSGALIMANLNPISRNQNVLSIFMEYCPSSVQDLLQKCTIQGTASCPDGRNLPATLLEQFPLPYVVHLVKQLIDAVLFLHGRSIAHRDIKPANLLLTADESTIHTGRLHYTPSINANNPSGFLSTMKLSDFGSAVNGAAGSEDGASSSPTATETNTTNTSNPTAAASIKGVDGTPRYMAPEIFRDEVYTRNCDLWSIGMTVLDMLYVMPTEINNCRSIPDFLGFYNSKAVVYQPSSGTSQSENVSATGIGLGLFGGMSSMPIGLGGGLAAAVAAAGYTSATNRNVPQSVSPFFPQLSSALEALVEQHVNHGTREIPQLHATLCRLTKERLQNKDSRVYTKPTGASSTSTRTTLASNATRVTIASNRRTSSTYSSNYRLQQPAGAAMPLIDINNSQQLITEAKAHITHDLCQFLETCLAFRPDQRCHSAAALMALPLSLNPMLSQWFDLYYNKTIGQSYQGGGGLSSPGQPPYGQQPSLSRAPSTSRYHRTASEYGGSAALVRAGTTIVLTSSTHGGASRPQSRNASMSHVHIDRIQLNTQHTDSTRQASTNHGSGTSGAAAMVALQGLVGMGAAHPISVGGYIGASTTGPFGGHHIRHPPVPITNAVGVPPTGGQFLSAEPSPPNSNSSSTVHNLASTANRQNLSPVGYTPARLPSIVHSNSNMITDQPFAVPVAISLSPQPHDARGDTHTNRGGEIARVLSGVGDFGTNGPSLWFDRSEGITAAAVNSGSWTADDSTEEEYEEYEEVEEEEEDDRPVNGGQTGWDNASQSTSGSERSDIIGSGQEGGDGAMIPLQAANVPSLPPVGQLPYRPVPASSQPLSLNPQPTPPTQQLPPTAIQALFNNIFQQPTTASPATGFGTSTGVTATTSGLPQPQNLAATAGLLGGGGAFGDINATYPRTTTNLSLTHNTVVSNAGGIVPAPLLSSVPVVPSSRGVIVFDDDEDD